MPVVHIESKYNATLPCGKEYNVRCQRQLIKLVSLHKRTCEMCRNDEDLTYKSDNIHTTDTTYLIKSSNVKKVGEINR